MSDESKLLLQNINDIIDDIKSRMPVDRSQLEMECERQASFYDEVGDQYALARAEARSAEGRLKETKARLNMEVRRNPAAFGLDKVTETAAENVVLIHPDYIKALEESNNWQWIADRLGSEIIALTERKSMISDLVSLFCTNYYSSSKDLQADAQERINKIKEFRAGKSE